MTHQSSPISMTQVKLTNATLNDADFNHKTTFNLTLTTADSAMTLTQHQTGLL